MKRRALLIFLPLSLLLVAMLALPAFLKALPSRYLARLPEPLQEIGAPAITSPILPTAVVTAVSPLSAGALLQIEAEIETAASAVSAQAEPLNPTLWSEPATPTPRLTNNNLPAENLPAEPTPEPTLEPTATAIPLPPSGRLQGITHYFQEWNNCGPATLSMTLSYFGLYVSQSQTAAFLKPNPEDRNVSPEEMVAYVEQHADGVEAVFRANGDLDTIRRLLAHDIPVVVEIGIDPPGEFRWLGWFGHYLLIVAYNDEQGQFWVYDSWFGTSEEPLQNAHPSGRVLSYAEMDTYWTHFNRNYIAFYRPEQAELLADLIGPAMEDAVMWQQALPRIRAETAADPDNAFHWFNLGTVYNNLGRYEEAAIAFDQARAIGLPWRMLWYQFGPYEAYYQIGRYDDVLLLAETTLKDRPYFEESFYYKGLAQAALGQTDIARTNLQKAVNFNPNFTPAATALSSLDK
jgi:tetratricopeptide (TPR) repeat protein